MKSFRTEISLTPGPARIAHDTPVITIGSCFADTIGNRLHASKFPVTVNPLGTVYDPISIHKSLAYILHNELPLPSTYVENQGISSNFDFHSSISFQTKKETEAKISDLVGTAHHFLNNARALIITYGTARIHERRDSGERVANCHKLPSAIFSSRLLTHQEVTDSMDQLFSILTAAHPGLSIILTVSPVRHVKETLEGNSVSKAILRWCCHQAQENNDNISYFPAYEILMDDLRDYRFYEPDLIHPSSEAIDYIWEKFSDQYLSPASRELVARWEKIQTALRHRPFHPGTAMHHKFLTETLHQLEELNSVLPVEEEIQFIQSQLTPHGHRS